MPIVWFKKKIRPWLIRLAQRHVGSTRRGPVRQVTDIRTWLSSHPGEGHWISEQAGWEQVLPASLHRETRNLVPQEPANYFVHAGNFVAQITGAFVSGPSVGVITPDRQLLVELSVEFGHSPEQHGAMRKILFPKPTRLPGRWGLLAITGGNSYYHHMTEVLPRVEMIHRANIQDAELKGWIINGSSHPYQRESWQRLGLFAETLHSLEDCSYYQCEFLVVPSTPTNPGRVAPWIPPFLRNLFGVQPRRGSRRIYFQRHGTGSREIEDEEDLLRLLRTFSFEAISAETLSIQEQARLCSEAEAIVGPHGGALTNAVFAPPGALLLEFFHPRYLNPCYWQLAGICGLRHAHVLGQTEGADHQAPAGDASGHIRLGTEGLEKTRSLLSALLTSDPR